MITCRLSKNAGKSIPVGTFLNIQLSNSRSVNWDDVKNYLETYVGEFYEIANTKDIVYINPFES